MTWRSGKLRETVSWHDRQAAAGTCIDRGESLRGTPGSPATLFPNCHRHDWNLSYETSRFRRFDQPGFLRCRVAFGIQRFGAKTGAAAPENQPVAAHRGQKSN